MAQLKDKIEESKALINNSVSFYIYPHQKFLYDSINQLAWLSDGRFGYIPKEEILELKKEEIFKFNFFANSFIINDNDEIIIYSKNINIDYKYLIISAANHNEKSLKSLFETRQLLKEELKTIHDSLFWRIFNNWTDIALSKFLDKNSTIFINDFAEYLLHTVKSDPIIDKKSYIKFYYPLTFKLLKKYI